MECGALFRDLEEALVIANHLHHFINLQTIENRAVNIRDIKVLSTACIEWTRAAMYMKLFKTQWNDNTSTYMTGTNISEQVFATVEYKCPITDNVIEKMPSLYTRVV